MIGDPSVQDDFDPYENYREFNIRSFDAPIPEGATDVIAYDYDVFEGRDEHGWFALVLMSATAPDNTPIWQLSYLDYEPGTNDAPPENLFPFELEWDENTDPETWGMTGDMAGLEPSVDFLGADADPFLNV